MRPHHPLASAVLLLAIACGQAGPATTSSTDTPGSTPTPTASVSIDPAPDPRVTDRVDVPGQPRGLALHEGRLWVTRARVDRVTAIDTTSLQVTADAAAGPTPVSVLTLDGALWISLVDRGRIGDGQGLARLDPATGHQEELVTAPVFHNVVAAASALWVLDGGTGLQHIEPGTGRVSTIEVGSRTQAIEATDEAVWGVQENGGLWRVDAEARQVTATAELGMAVGGRTRVGVVDGALWIGTMGAVLVRDATTLEERATVPLAGLEFVNDVEAGDDTVWVAATLDVPSRAVPVAVVLGFDRGRYRLRDSITFGREAGEIVVDGATLWAADQGADTVVRIDLG